MNMQEQETEAKMHKTKASKLISLEGVVPLINN